MVTTTRATCSVPGTTGRHYYGEGEDESLMIWRSANPRPRTPVLVYCKPGHAFNMGERVMDPHTSSSAFIGTMVDTLYSTYDWPIVGIEFRPPHSIDSPKREPFSNRPWPGPLLSAQKAMHYLREHADTEALWGEGGSISTNQIAWVGSSSGHTMGLLLACLPPGRGPLNATAGLHQRALGTTDHRPDAVIGAIGQIDWTQFAFDSADLTGPFGYDFHQYFFGRNSGLTWTALANSIKQSASPWWWLPFLEAKRTAFWGAWGSRPGSGAGANLTPEVWLPGRMQGNKSAGRMFKDPHHYFQAKPWHDALAGMGCNVRTIWGTNTDNPTGPNNSNVGLNSTTTAADAVKFVQGLGWR